MRNQSRTLSAPVQTILPPLLNAFDFGRWQCIVLLRKYMQLPFPSDLLQTLGHEPLPGPGRNVNLKRNASALAHWPTSPVGRLRYQTTRCPVLTVCAASRPRKSSALDSSSTSGGQRALRHLQPVLGPLCPRTRSACTQTPPAFKLPAHPLRHARC